MKRIMMGSEVLVTDARVADLVLRYAGVLARSGSADTVSIPVVSESGAVQQAQLLIGPASQVILTEDGEGGLDAGSTLEDLQRRIASHGGAGMSDDLLEHEDDPVDDDPEAYIVRFDDYER